MSNEKTEQMILEGYQPLKKGYQPPKTTPPATDPKPHSGYQPTGVGSSPTNPTPPGDE